MGDVMKYTNDIIEINYSKQDKEYIEEVINYITIRIPKILLFFQEKSLDKKIKIKLWDSIDDFRNYMKLDLKRELADYIVGLSEKEEIHVVSLNELIKNRPNDNLEDLKKLIIHEIVHTIHLQSRNYNWSLSYVSEGIATYLSGQYSDSKLLNNLSEIPFSIEKILMGEASYDAYYILFAYLFENSSREYILNLVKGTREYQEKEAYKIYKGANEWLKKKNKK